MPGRATLAPEVTNISRHGFWLLLGSEEVFLPFQAFPWFKKASVEEISQVEWPSEDHLYWPRLDIDLSVQSIRNPDAFPLVAKGAR